MQPKSEYDMRMCKPLNVFALQAMRRLEPLVPYSLYAQAGALGVQRMNGRAVHVCPWQPGLWSALQSEAGCVSN